MEAPHGRLLSSLLGKRVTILSIDGGGIRGLIPAKMLEFLEDQLQSIDGPDARIADYFDVMAGTSTGALIASVLAIPDEKGRPRFTAKDTTLLYTERSPTIFTRRSNLPFSQLLGPKYTTTGLEEVLQETCKDLRMKDTLTNVVIPTYDIKQMEPTYFSTCEAKRDESKNALLRQVLRATTAAPTYFPPSQFYTTTASGERREYNLVDGGVGNNNPTHHAIVHVQRELFSKNTGYAKRSIAQDYNSLLVLSLGTGTVAESYDANQAANWGTLSWIHNNNKAPILDMEMEASAYVVDFNLSVIFNTSQCPQNYLRIQALDLSGEVTNIDNTQSSNIQALLDISAKLLDTNVTSMDMDTGKLVLSPDQGTNREALIRFAKLLTEECKARHRLFST